MNDPTMNGDCVRSTITAADGHQILVDQWPAAEPRGIVQIFHGLAEHAARYERFAGECNKAGFHVVAHSHRGHGENCAADELGHFADAHGWPKVINDALLVQLDVTRRNPELPLILFGHSMGSYIAQSFMICHPGKVKALVLSGSTYASRLQLRALQLVARIEGWLTGVGNKSDRLNKIAFGDFNKAFEPSRSEFDWLSRDEAEVDLYVNDPLCGGPSTCRLWLDLIGGLLQITSARELRRIPDIPLMITGGQMDPVGGEDGMTKLANAYNKSNHSDVTLTVYPDGRHEMLNETNRDEVTADVVGWMSDKL